MAEETPDVQVHAEPAEAGIPVTEPPVATDMPKQEAQPQLGGKVLQNMARQNANLSVALAKAEAVADYWQGRYEQATGGASA